MSLNCLSTQNGFFRTHREQVYKILFQKISSASNRDSSLYHNVQLQSRIKMLSNHGINLKLSPENKGP